jgi:hypothetical protein
VSNSQLKATIDASTIPFATAPGTDEIKKLSSARISYTIQANLPFNLTKWSAVFTGPCPHYSHEGHRTECGLLWANHRIWRDFIYFEPDILSFATDQNQHDKDSIYTLLTVFSDGRLIKNHTPYKPLSSSKTIPKV